jgi:hypothetical protein
MVRCVRPPHPRTGTPHGWVSLIIHCARTGGPNSQEKDICQLESAGDRKGQSSWVHPWVLKAILFLKPFLLRFLRASCIMNFLYTQSLVVRRNEQEKEKRI